MSSEHRSLVDVIKSLISVNFVECRDGFLWYDAHCADESHRRPEWTLRFRIPFEDTAGGVFPSAEYDNCRYYQRWIRKELELYKIEQAAIAKAKAEWEP